ncbi:hypothetical protein ACFXPA_16515 [Amycolatopsis sp. NPDC059090]|uniref:hypothetical protein n=1 Tax=Amycolatopsis sp. NPDC059090 TaxID=3346723 RepID=UPI00366FE615
MTMMHLPRRTSAVAGLALLTGAPSVLTAMPALADPLPEVVLSVSQSVVHPGDTFTVTETINNINDFTVLHPTALLLTLPDGLSSYTSLVGCAGIGTCSDTATGYESVLPEAMDQHTGNTTTFTLKVDANASDLTETLRGQLVGSNFASEPVNGPTITVDASADAAVSVKVTPHPGLLSGQFDFAVTVANHGPGLVRNAKITTTLPLGLSGNASGACAPSSGKVVCTVNGLANGSSTTSNFSVPFGLLTIGLPFEFTTSRTSSDSRDPNAANDSVTTTCTAVTSLLVNCEQGQPPGVVRLATTVQKGIATLKAIAVKNVKQAAHRR